MKPNDLLAKKEFGSDKITGGEHVDVVALIELYKLAKEDIEKDHSSLLMSKTDFYNLTIALRAFGHVQSEKFFDGVITSITSINPNYPFVTEKDRQLFERLGISENTDNITDEEVPSRSK